MNMLSKEQIEDLLGYIGVDKIGRWKGNNIQFCCPIHGESHPSCGICADYTPQDEIGAHYQIFNCFSCGASGTLVWLLYKSMPDTFKSVAEAEKFISERYNIDYRLLVQNLTSHKIKRIDTSEHNNNGGQIKTISKSFIAPFKSGKATYKHFFERGYDVNDLKEWSIGRDLENKTVTIPVFLKDGSLVGVIGRYIDPNRPKNMRYKIYGFHKSDFVFPENKLEVINDTIIGVEGMFDCMMLHKWGRPNTVAIMGNKLSEKQADFIASNCKKFIGLWDNDDGGKKAEERARKLLKNRVEYLSCDYSSAEGKDPSEWGEYLTNKILSTASIIGKRKVRRI